MKNILHNKMNFAILVLMIIWNVILLITWVIPSFKLEIDIVNIYIEEIIAGYADYLDRYFVQTEVIYPITYNIFLIFSFMIVTIFLIMSILKPRMIKIVGFLIIVQSFILLSLEIWSNYLMDKITNTVIFDIGLWLFLIMVITGMCIWLSIKYKLFYCLLGIVTVLQLFNTINQVSIYRTAIYNIYIIFQCFNRIVLLILYWALTITLIKQNNKKNIN